MHKRIKRLEAIIIAVKIIDKIWDTYYKFFPEELEKKLERERQEKIAKERKEKAGLLLEYEEVLKKRKELAEDLRWEAQQLEEFSKVIYESLNGNPFEKRRKKKSALKIMESFDAKQLSNYEAVKQKAIECERLAFRIYTLRQKLKLFGIDRGIKEQEGDFNVFGF